MATRYTYSVTGKGKFPLDMLRFDSCWPADAQSVMRLTVDSDSEYFCPIIVLQSYFPPTVARWASFGWTVGADVRKTKTSF